MFSVQTRAVDGNDTISEYCDLSSSIDDFPDDLFTSNFFIKFKFYPK